MINCNQMLVLIKLKLTLQTLKLMILSKKTNKNYFMNKIKTQIMKKKYQNQKK